MREIGSVIRSHLERHHDAGYYCHHFQSASDAASFVEQWRTELTNLDCVRPHPPF